MDHFAARWNVLAVVLTLATMLGCQGLSTGKSNVQGTQSSLSGVLSAAPPSISFGNVQVGTSQTITETVTNTGGSSLTVTQATVTGTGYSITGVTLPLILAVGQSAAVTVVFVPTNAGSASGNLAVTADSGSVNISISGMGVTAGDLTTSPTSFSFGNVVLGNASTQTETLKNTGSTNLSVTAAAVTGSGFSYTGLSLPLTLAPNQASTFSVSFTPSTAAASDGNLSLTVSGSTTSVDMALSGTGVPPATLTTKPTSLIFTNVQLGQSSTQTGSVTNTGGSNAQISQVAASGTGFSVSGITLPVTLTPGQSTSFSVTFAPEASGNVSGSVAISSNASNPKLSVTLSGSAVASQGTLSVSPVNVGSVTVGTSGTQTGTLNATGASVSVSSVSLSGTNPSEFSISSLSFPVTVTTSQPVSFTVKFTPGATGAAAATASFASNASSSPTSAVLTGTGTAAPVHSVNLSWTASTSSGVTSYNVYRAVYGTISCGSYSKIGSTPSSSTTYTDTVVVDGTTYCYATTAVDPSGESGYSNISQAAIPPP